MTSKQQQKSYLLPILMMIALFAMISFVTGLQNPMGVIVKNQFGASNAMSQLGNAANFIAYAFMGIPAGLLLTRLGYKKTALVAVAVGFVGVGIQFISGQAASFPVFLLGAFVSGFSMCMLNTVVNPMLNTLGGGGKKGNQLIQLGGTVNSLSATIVPVFVGYLIGNEMRAQISDANPALFIAMGIFALVFVVLLIMNIPEPHMTANSSKEDGGVSKSIIGALRYRHFLLGAIAIFVYVGVEVGIPNFVNLYMTTLTKEQFVEYEKEYNKQQTNASYLALLKEQAKMADEKYAKAKETGISKDQLKVLAKEADEANDKIYTKEKYEQHAENKVPGLGMNTTVAGSVVGTYWFLMLLGRLFIGTFLGTKLSSKTMLTMFSGLGLILILLAIFLNPSIGVSMPVFLKDISFGMVQVPVNILFLILCGLCTSVMWGGIFNLAVEKLGKYTTMASGIFMVMVCGGGLLPLVQGVVADSTSFLTSYWVVLAGLAYLLFYALVGSKVSIPKGEAE